jgi:hypothetical protein
MMIVRPERVLVVVGIVLHLSRIGLSQADDMERVATLREYHAVKPVADQAKSDFP